jgi:hypothetical protein
MIQMRLYVNKLEVGFFASEAGRVGVISANEAAATAAQHSARRNERLTELVANLILGQAR